MHERRKFIELANVARRTILIAAAESVTYKWDYDGQNGANRYKVENLRRAFELAKCLIILEQQEDKATRAKLAAVVQSCYTFQDYQAVCAAWLEDLPEDLLTMPIGRGEHGSSEQIELALELNGEQLKALGFQLWDEERNRDGRRLWCIPLWLVPFLKCGQPVTSILGVDKLTGPDLDNDHRGGCVAYGFYLHA